MKEAFLHYIWQYKLFSFTDLKTEQGESLQIIRSGEYTQQSGPDFFNSLIVLGNQKWAGNIEIHTKSSDWYLHHHERDKNYDNVILHVVWEYDVPVMRSNQTEIPVLLLSKYVDCEILKRYRLLDQPKKWIYCEDFIGTMDVFKRNKWLETLFFERMQHKVNPIKQLLIQHNSDWESVFFCQIAQGFGLNINGATFLNMAKSLPIQLVNKERLSVSNLEALFFGKTNILRADFQEYYGKNLWDTWLFLSHKYQLDNLDALQVSYFKLHPDNFPSIRLSQLANLIHQHSSLFDAILQATTKADYYKILDISTSEYWRTHYIMDKISPSKNKRTTQTFIDLIIINTVIPLKYAYYQSKGMDYSDALLDLVSSLKPEKNSIIDYFSVLGVAVNSSFDTQSLLHLKKHYCDAKKCLSCGIGRAYLYKDKIK
ncbi:DUF2851 family protein [Flavobacterium sp. NKUCC04_CG]|uniref:DUF2851 family protein n=1 Tax=Flavobacterium sp. NKUCC04_CG TaxID=2842121 RepID=UPI001C5BAC38|nr:DUF2851 family protein [Flavobacterium sp. NKUCC04_CG]MBW3517719.1 DUF2851 family protein [Flavobacterium sp. NKUCC04_CG]